MTKTLTESKQEPAGPLAATHILCYRDRQAPVQHDTFHFPVWEIQGHVHLMFVQVSPKSFP